MFHSRLLFTRSLDFNGPIQKCSTADRKVIVRGVSLEPLIHNSQTVKVEYGYYACHVPTRGDIIIYRYNQNRASLIKIIKGIPGDSVALKEIRLGEWLLLINGKKVINSEGIAYKINNSGFRMLSLYIRSYNSVIPENTYLILGDQPFGFFDNPVLGLVGKNGILGKVIYNSP